MSGCGSCCLGCLRCDCHSSMARLFDRFDPDRERWSSYLMRTEFYFDSNNLTTDQTKKAALCSTMSPGTFAHPRICLPGKSYSVPKWQNYSAKSCAKCTNKRQTTQHEVHAVRHSQPSRQKQRFRDKQRPEHAERGQANTQPSRRGQKVCYRCGSLTHHHRDCPFINAVCYRCDRKGHIQAVCRSSGKPVRQGKMALNTWWNC